MVHKNPYVCLSKADNEGFLISMSLPRAKQKYVEDTEFLFSFREGIVLLFTPA